MYTWYLISMTIEPVMSSLLHCEPTVIQNHVKLLRCSLARYLPYRIVFYHLNKRVLLCVPTKLPSLADCIGGDTHIHFRCRLAIRIPCCITIGVRQGNVLSPVLLAITTQPLVREQSLGVSRMHQGCYLDDGTFVAPCQCRSMQDAV